MFFFTVAFEIILYFNIFKVSYLSEMLVIVMRNSFITMQWTIKVQVIGLQLVT